MLSFWERDVFQAYDYIVVGGGIVGLSTAIELKERDYQKTVLLLEEGVFPNGASTKNAGFACFGSLTEILSDLTELNPTEVQNLVALRWEGLQKLRARLGDATIDYQNHGGYELLFEHQLGPLNRLEEVNELLRPILKDNVYRIDRDIDRFGFNSKMVKAMIFNPFEGQIHSGKMMLALQQKASELGVKIITGAKVHTHHENSSQVSVYTDRAEFYCTKLAICTNAFAKQLIPDLDLNPGRGVVLVTKPIHELKIKGTYHYEEGYYYFRNYQGRVIFGGARNLDFEGESSTIFEVRDLIKNRLVSDLETLILPEQRFEIDHFWAGIMAFGPNKQPLLKQISPNVFAGVRLGGMGVAIGSKLGYDLASKMLA